jgi:hypothetical protein
MRRIENMKTLNVYRAGLRLTARNNGITRTVRLEKLPEPAANSGAAIERQLDEIQHTFGVRWEW